MLRGRLGALDITSKVVVAPDHLSAQMGEESVVLATGPGVYYGLDAVGATVWGLLQTPVVVADIRDHVAENYDVDEATCERDVLAFLDDLGSRGMIEVIDAPDP
jgi:hypothetical protein